MNDEGKGGYVAVRRLCCSMAWCALVNVYPKREVVSHHIWMICTHKVALLRRTKHLDRGLLKLCKKRPGPGAAHIWPAWMEKTISQQAANDGRVGPDRRPKTEDPIQKKKLCIFIFIFSIKNWCIFTFCCNLWTEELINVKMGSCDFKKFYMQFVLRGDKNGEKTVAKM